MLVGVERSQELVWQGRIHLGDDPGTYGNASYAGLIVELPVTLRPFAETQEGDPDDINFDLTFERVGVIPPHLGHKLSLYAYEARLGTVPPPRLITETRVTGGQATLSSTETKGLRHVSVRVEVDKAIAPGLYNDFLLTSLSLRSLSHLASFGFQRS